MKTQRNILTGLLAVACLFATSCMKDFEEVNTNPNALPETRPELLLETAIFDLRRANQTRELRVVHEMMQVHVSVINSDEFHRYIIRPSESTYMWHNWYLERTNFLDIYDNAQNLLLVPGQAYNRIYMGISRILDAYTLSLITDTYGDVPNTEANKGRTESNFQPAFDKQEVVYDTIFSRLEQANELLNTTEVIPTALTARDPLYAGDAGKWRRFGNSLYLRLLLRASGRPESGAVAKITEMIQTSPANYPLMANNAESAVLRFTTTVPFVSAFNTYRDYDFNGENGISEFFVSNLNAWNDPRRAKWMTTVGGQYVGIPSGYVPGDQQERQSVYLAALKNEPRTGNILNYAEVQFMLAEVAAKGYANAANAKTYYDNGVTNAITFWDAVVPAGYLNNPAIQWNEADTEEQKMEKIITQKYYTYFFTDFQSWFEYRRTGYPDLPIGPGVQNNGVLPTRFVYPTSVQTLNRTNYANAVAAMDGPDNMLTRVWWDVD